MLPTRLLITLAGATVLALSSIAFGQGRSAEEVLAALAALKAPEYEQARRGEPNYANDYIAARNAFLHERAALARELYDADPAHPQVPELMMERWNTLGRDRDFDTVLEETGKIAPADSPFGLDAAYMYAQTFGEKCGWDFEQAMPVVDAFIARAPKDERSARLLYSAAGRAPEQDTRLALYRRMLAEFPDSRATKYVPGIIRQVEELGKPFELTFQEATTGETVDLASQRGTIFVIDFWATWCGPCIGEMPHMKELYAEYKDKGVQFIGVSLDQPEDKGGLEKLRTYVKDNEVAWPQYYQGNYWESEFSTSWGINSIPRLFVVDHEGNLFSTDARGQLEKVLPELIARREAKN